MESEVEGPWVQDAPLRRSVPPLDANQLQRYLQLPALAPAIPALARQVAGPSRTPEEIAQSVEEFLRTKFRYTLDIERVSKLDPLQEFLIVRRAGHCEYFAAEMAVMHQQGGVTGSRMIAGTGNAPAHNLSVNRVDPNASLMPTPPTTWPLRVIQWPRELAPASIAAVARFGV